MQPTTPAVSTSSVAIRYGLLTGLVSILYMFLTFATGQESNQALQWAGLIIPIVSIYLAHTAFKKQNDGYMSYGQGLGIGMLLTLVSSVLTISFNYLYRTVIDPDLPSRILEGVRAKMEAKGNMTDAQIDQAMAMSAKFSTGPLSIVVGLVFSVILGLLVSLVVAAITKKAKPEFE